VLALFDDCDRAGNVEGMAAQHVRRDLAVEHRRGDVGIVGRALAPADLAPIRG
jgi:hypothetical protein